jgi:hypothetical protein
MCNGNKQMALKDKGKSNKACPHTQLQSKVEKRRITINPLYNSHPWWSLFFMTLINCDLNMYSHIQYKPLQDYDYRQEKTLQNN